MRQWGSIEAVGTRGELSVTACCLRSVAPACRCCSPCAPACLAPCLADRDASLPPHLPGDGVKVGALCAAALAAAHLVAGEERGVVILLPICRRRRRSAAAALCCCCCRRCARGLLLRLLLLLLLYLPLGPLCALPLPLARGPVLRCCCCLLLLPLALHCRCLPAIRQASSPFHRRWGTCPGHRLPGAAKTR